MLIQDRIKHATEVCSLLYSFLDVGVKENKSVEADARRLVIFWIWTREYYGHLMRAVECWMFYLLLNIMATVLVAFMH